MDVSNRQLGGTVAILGTVLFVMGGIKTIWAKAVSSQIMGLGYIAMGGTSMLMGTTIMNMSLPLIPKTEEDKEQETPKEGEENGKISKGRTAKGK